MVDHIKPDAAIYSATLIDVRFGSKVAAASEFDDVRFDREGCRDCHRLPRSLRVKRRQLIATNREPTFSMNGTAVPAPGEQAFPRVS